MGVFILIIGTLLYCLVHSLTASNQAKALARRWFGARADRWYRLVFNLFSGITFLPILWLLTVLPDRTLYALRMPWLAFTTIAQIMGAFIIVIGIIQTGAFSFIGFRQLVSKDRINAGGIFVESGLYQWVRHPLYTGGLVFIWFAPVMTVNLLTLFSVLTLYLIIGARLEEGRLLAEFGDVYEVYKKEVPMLIPRVPKG